jgi:hypothetical protein
LFLADTPLIVNRPSTILPSARSNAVDEENIHDIAVEKTVDVNNKIDT